MKTKISLIFLCLLCASCAGEREQELVRLDEMLECSDIYSGILRHKADSLRESLGECTDDESRWEKYKALQYIYSVNNLDSSYRYSLLMDSLAGDDTRRQTISKCALFKNRWKLSVSDEAFPLLNGLDEYAPMDSETMEYYYEARQMMLTRMRELGTYSDVNITEEKNKLFARHFQRDSTAAKARFEYGNILAAGGRYGEALEMYFSSLGDDCRHNARAHILIARAYERLGDMDRMIHHLVLSSMNDLKEANREYTSLQKLAMVLYEDGDLDRACRYIERAVEDAYASNYSELFKTAVSSEMVFKKALRRSEERQRRIMIVISLVLAGLLLLIFSLTLYLNKYSRRLAASVKDLNRANRSLNERTRIQDSFLAEYMELASQYIRVVDDTKSMLRRTAKKEGVEAMMALLRTPPYMDSEAPNYYGYFDKTFLGLFPDFIDELNAIMDDAHKFSLTPERALTIQLRILALIRLGIDSSRRIGNILNVTTGTVYTYRCIMRNSSILPPDEFEKAVRTLCAQKFSVS